MTCYEKRTKTEERLRKTFFITQTRLSDVSAGVTCYCGEKSVEILKPDGLNYFWLTVADPELTNLSDFRDHQAED